MTLEQAKEIFRRWLANGPERPSREASEAMEVCVKEARDVLRGWMEITSTGPCPEVYEAIRFLAVEELNMPSDPSRIDEEVRAVFKKMRQQAEGYGRMLRKELAELMEGRNGAADELINAAAGWCRKAAQDKDDRDSIERLIYHCANNLAAWFLFANLAAVVADSWLWPGTLLPQVAVSKISPGVGKLSRRITNAEGADCRDLALARDTGAVTVEIMEGCIDVILEEARREPPRFRYESVAAAIQYFQFAADWKLGEKWKLQGRNRVPEAPLETAQVDWEMPDGADGEARRRLGRRKLRYELWNCLKSLPTNDRLPFWILGMLRAFEDPPSWEELSNREEMPRRPPGLPAGAAVRAFPSRIHSEFSSLLKPC